MLYAKPIESGGQGQFQVRGTAYGGQKGLLLSRWIAGKAAWR